MDFHLQETEMARAMIRQSSKVIVVADRSKFHTPAPVSVCGFADVGTLVTARTPPTPILRPLAQHEVRVIEVGSAPAAQAAPEAG